jgi:hypothetical protein
MMDTRLDGFPALLAEITLNLDIVKLLALPFAKFNVQALGMGKIIEITWHSLNIFKLVICTKCT